MKSKKATYADTVKQTYEQAELNMLKTVKARLAKGIGEPGWAERKLAELRKLNDELNPHMKSVREVNAGVDEILTKAYDAGAEKAVQELKAAQLLDETSDKVTRGNALRAMSRQTVEGLDQVGMQIFRSAGDAYRDCITQVSGQMLVGGLNPKQALQQALNYWADRGITGFKDSLGRNWTAQSYADMAIHTASLNAHRQGHFDQVYSSGFRLVKISTHSPTCPLCYPWQGKIVSLGGERVPLESADDKKKRTQAEQLAKAREAAKVKREQAKADAAKKAEADAKAAEEAKAKPASVTKAKPLSRKEQQELRANQYGIDRAKGAEGWQPAGTVKEAVMEIGNYVHLVPLSMSKLNLNQLNSISRGLYKTLGVYDKKIASIDLVVEGTEAALRNPRALAWYEPATDIIRFRPGAIEGLPDNRFTIPNKVVRDKVRVKEGTKQILDRGYVPDNLSSMRWNSYQVSEDPWEAVTMHEVGHALQRDGGVTYLWDKALMGDNPLERKLGMLISDYAMTNTEELFAEITALVHNGQSDLVPKPLLTRYLGMLDTAQSQAIKRTKITHIWGGGKK